MTKKAIKEAIKNAPRFVVYIDYKASSTKSTDTKPLAATDIISAMDEAEKLRTDDVYLMKIAENTGCVSEENALTYIEKLCSRSYNWYHNDAAHGEHTCTHDYYLEGGVFTFGRVTDWA